MKDTASLKNRLTSNLGNQKFAVIAESCKWKRLKTVDDLLKLSDILHENKFDYDKLGKWCDFIIHSPDADGYSIEVYDGYKE